VLYATIFRWRVTANVFNETFNLRASLALVSPPRIDRPAELSRKDLNFDETTLKPERAIDSFISRDEGFKTTKAYSFFPPGIDIRRTSTSMYDPIGAASIIYQRQVARVRARARVGPSRSQLTTIKLAV